MRAPTMPVRDQAADDHDRATWQFPLLCQMSPQEGRKAVETLQSGNQLRPDPDTCDVGIDGCLTGSVPVCIVLAGHR